MAFAALVIAGYKGPELFLKNKSKKRTDAIRKGLPDALDLLVICAEAGLTVDAAFNRVAKELGRAYPELGDEFTLTAIELSFLTERRQAFENFAYRVDLDAVKGVVTTMIQTERYGTPLASALRVLSAEFRNERMMRAGREGRAAAGDHDRAADPVHPAGAVHRHSRAGRVLDRRRLRRRRPAGQRSLAESLGARGAERLRGATRGAVFVFDAETIRPRSCRCRYRRHRGP
jgi:hypothetical protein